MAAKATVLARVAAAGACCAALVVGREARAADAPHPSKLVHAAVAASPRPAPKSAPHAAHAADPAPRRPGPVAIVGVRSSDGAAGVEGLALRALREADRDLFPGASSARRAAWSSDLPIFRPANGGPEVDSSGLPLDAELTPSSSTSATHAPGDVSWLAGLELPDIPVRWDDRVIRYLTFFRDDPRGRAIFSSLFRRSGRVIDMLRRELRSRSLPEDLAWVAMIESGFDPTARSVSGAVGLWQFMPETARYYGLVTDRWLDQRYNGSLATAAAAELLADLHRRFGSWELALAAYNMGTAGLESVVRRYNTNDFWSLARAEGSLPWETTLYVPKIVAAAVVAHNLAKFGYADLAIDGPMESDTVDVAPGTSLAVVAQAAGCEPKDVEALNPELRAARTPPESEGIGSYSVRVPWGRGASAARALVRLRRDTPALDRYVVRFGETIEQIATAHKTTAQRLVELNAMAPGTVVRGGTTLLVPMALPIADPLGGAPRVEHKASPQSEGDAPLRHEEAAPAVSPRQTVIVPTDSFVYPDRRRVFYRVITGDRLVGIAATLGVGVEDLCAWNDLDPTARLQSGMTLQAFVPRNADLSRVAVTEEGDAHVVPVGSDEFFASFDPANGFRRITIASRAGDTIEAVGKRFGVAAATMERINRRGRGEALKVGEPVVIYVTSAARTLAPTVAAALSQPVTALDAPAPNGPCPPPPMPSLLP